MPKGVSKFSLPLLCKSASLAILVSCIFLTGYPKFLSALFGHHENLGYVYLATYLLGIGTLSLISRLEFGIIKGIKPFIGNSLLLYLLATTSVFGPWIVNAKSLSLALQPLRVSFPHALYTLLLFPFLSFSFFFGLAFFLFGSALYRFVERRGRLQSFQ